MRTSRLWLLALLAVLGTGAVRAQTIQNVFVVVIDGLRNTEGFEAESTYLPHIWNDLRPQGTINRKFWNRGWTATTGGHTTIMSGVRQILLNNGSNPQEVRSTDPLMYEYYRKQFGAPESACGTIVGKWGNVGDIAGFGLEPAFGEPYKGFQRGDTSTSEDSACARLVHSAMDSLHPRLVLVNLGDVDHMGHIDSLGGVLYQSAIRTADSIIYDFWKHIQADSPYTDTFYRNRTALLVINDHGRHDDAHGGFNGHGNWDHGSRHIMFLALGPGITRNKVIDNIPRDHIDLVPTIAGMLGFAAPFSEGNVMSELFTAGAAPHPVRYTMSGPGGPPAPLAFNLSNNPGFSRDPDIARDRFGNLYTVWSDNTPGKWSVQYRKSTDQGASWIPAQTMFDYPASDSVMWFARVAADDSVAVSATGYGKVANWLDSARTRLDTTFIWYPWIATSADQGASWGVKSLFDSSMGTSYGPIAVKNGRYSVAWWATGKFSIDTLNSGMLFNNRAANGNWRGLPVGINTTHSIHVSVADGGTALHVAASVWQTKDWDLAYYRSVNGDSWKIIWVAKDPSGRATYDYDPELAVDDTGMVHLVWARKENLGGAWQLMYGRLTSQTDTTFDTTRLTTSSAGAWQPHIATKGCTLALVWIDYRDGNPELYCAFSPDRGVTWSTPERITYSTGLTHHPRVAPIDKGFYVLWQDNSSGNWEVYGRQISTLASRDIGVVRIDAPAGSVDSLTPITPSVTFQNFGPAAATFKAWFWIQDALGDTVYHDSAIVSDLAGGAIGSQAFPTWPLPYTLGNYSTWCRISYLGDWNPANDALGGSLTIVRPNPAWYPRTSLPIGFRNKSVKDGGALAYAEPRDSVTIYALKGNNRLEFYEYNLSGNFWTTRESIPAYNMAGKKKSVKKGSSLTATRGSSPLIYATKGNSTLDLWRFDPAAIGIYPWAQLADVPYGAKTLKEGTGSAAVQVGDTNFVYLLKGSNTLEFYRFNTMNGTWQTMASAPIGIAGKSYRNGSTITSDGDKTIYALKGSYNELYAYRLDSNNWTTKASLPLIGSMGRKKKVKDGAGLAWHGRILYALKGGNTLEFWRYFCDSDRWVQCPDFPTGRYVKGGGALVHAERPNSLFALRGNSTLDFYTYFPLGADLAPLMTQSDPAITGSVTGTTTLGLRISPNPLSFLNPHSTFRITYSLPQPGNFSLRLYDITGKLKATLAAGARPSGSYTISVDQRSSAAKLSSGVYFLRLETESAQATEKLLID